MEANPRGNSLVSHYLHTYQRIFVLLYTMSPDACNAKVIEGNLITWKWAIDIQATQHCQWCLQSTPAGLWWKQRWLAASYSVWGQGYCLFACRWTTIVWIWGKSEVFGNMSKSYMFLLVGSVSLGLASQVRLLACTWLHFLNSSAHTFEHLLT